MAHFSLLVYSDSDPEEERQRTPDDNAEDSNTSGAQPPSFEPPSPLPPSTAEPILEPIHRRLTIASLCNPMDEVVDIRQPQASSLFDRNLDAAHKPSWIKDYTCEQLFLYSLFSLTNMYT